MEKLLWVIAGALGLLGLLFLIFSPIGKVIGLCVFVLGCVLAAFLALHRWAQKKPKAARNVRRVLICILTMGLAAAIWAGQCILRAAGGNADADCKYILVLGAGVNGTVPSTSLKDRIQAAYAYLVAHPEAVAIGTGVQGKWEDISEGECIYRELTAMGIAPERVWVEDQARNTRENIEYSRALIRQRTGEDVDKLGIVTSEYHLYRAGLFTRQQGVEPVGIPAKTTKAYLFVDYFLREILAVWYYTIF